MKREENDTPQYQGDAADQKPDSHPAQACDHHYKEAQAVSVAEQVDSGQTRRRR